MSERLRVRPGLPCPLGATWGSGVEVAPFSANARFEDVDHVLASAGADRIWRLRLDSARGGLSVLPRRPSPRARRSRRPRAGCLRLEAD